MKNKKEKTKRLVFDDTDTRHAQLKVRLDYDGLTQAEFFRSFITGYLNKDDLVMNFLRKYKEDKKSQSKRNIKIIMKDYEKAEDLLSKFGIEQEELENIFDLIAKEHPDL
jgi:hydroxylamine reductase (hybrid-cluster protein)